MRLLLVEDDSLIGRGVNQALRDQGYAVDWVRDGLAARAQLAASVHDLAILDLGLPKLDGLAVLREARQSRCELPILILTARESPADRVLGLDAGADDYLIKPFDLEELAARIRALLRRRAGRSDPVIQHRGITLNPSTQQVQFHGATVASCARSPYVTLRPSTSPAPEDWVASMRNCACPRSPMSSRVNTALRIAFLYSGKCWR